MQMVRSVVNHADTGMLGQWMVFTVTEPKAVTCIIVNFSLTPQLHSLLLMYHKTERRRYV